MSLEVIKAEDVIVSQWEQFFGHRGVIEGSYQTDLGLLFEVEISAENFGYEKDGNTHHEEWERRFFAVLEIVVTARHEVFVRRHGNPVSMSKGAGPWVNTSNHDSCWRSDGLRQIWETLVEAHEHCWSHMPEQHAKSMNEMHTHCNVNGGVFSKGAVQFVRVKSQPGDGTRYGRDLVEVRRVGFKVIVED